MSYLDRLIAPRRLLCAAVAALSLLGAGAASAQATTPGQTLYATKCAICHQPSGGATNPAAGLTRVQLGVTSQVLQNAIAAFPSMQSLSSLTATEVADIAAYIAADVAANPPPPTPTGNAMVGRTLYASSCAACHGAVPASGLARVHLGTSAAVIQNAMINFPNAMSPTAMYRPGVPYALRFNLTPPQLDDVAAFIAADVAAKTTTTATEPGQTVYTAMCSSCHGRQFSKASNAASTISAIGRNKGGMGNLGFVTGEQATEIAVAMGAGGAGGGSGGGGCTLGRTDQPLDPLWLLMLVGAMGVLGLRRSAKA